MDQYFDKKRRFKCTNTTLPYAKIYEIVHVKADHVTPLFKTYTTPTGAFHIEHTDSGLRGLSFDHNGDLIDCKVKAHVDSSVEGLVSSDYAHSNFLVEDDVAHLVSSDYAHSNFLVEDDVAHLISSDYAHSTFLTESSVDGLISSDYAHDTFLTSADLSPYATSSYVDTTYAKLAYTQTFTGAKTFSEITYLKNTLWQYSTASASDYFKSIKPLYVQTTNDTETTMFTQGMYNGLYRVKCEIICASADLTNRLHIELYCTFTVASGVATLQGSVQDSILERTDEGLSATIVKDSGTNNGFDINVTGLSGTTINWTAYLNLYKV